MRPTSMHFPSFLFLFNYHDFSLSSPPLALKFIECMCECGLPLSYGDSVLDMWQTVVEDNLPHAEQSIRVWLV